MEALERRRALPRGWSLGVALTGVGIIVICGATSAYAICDPGRPGVFIGSSFSGGYANGLGPTVKYTDASSNISYYIPFVDYAHMGSVSVWPMLHQANCGLGYAQTGEVEIFGATYSRSFYEVENCNSVVTNGPVIFPAGGPNTNHYEVQHSGPGGGARVVQMYVNGINEVSQPGLVVDWDADNTDYSSETHSEDDQNYGGYSNHQTLSSLGECVTNLAGSSGCFKPNLNEVHSQTWMKDSLAPGLNYLVQQFDVWDSACST